LRLGGSVLFGLRARPQRFDGSGPPFETDSFTAEGHLSYPLLRRQAQSLFVSGGLRAGRPGAVVRRHA
jgi:hypothetical protein